MRSDCNSFRPSCPQTNEIVKESPVSSEVEKLFNMLLDISRHVTMRSTLILDLCFDLNFY